MVKQQLYVLRNGDMQNISSPGFLYGKGMRLVVRHKYYDE